VREEKHWQLLKDATKVMHLTLDRLSTLFQAFFIAVAHAEQSMVGPQLFRHVLAKNGCRDVVLRSRLFEEFCEMEDRIDYRVFLTILCSVSKTPIEERLGLLFDIWDIDRSDSLSHSELAQVILTGVPTSEMEAVTERFNRVWIEIRQNLPHDPDDWMESRASGLSKTELVAACQKLPAVKDFFELMLTRRAPSANQRRTSFSVRLRELHAEVLKEAKALDASQQGSSSRLLRTRSSSSPHLIKPPELRPIQTAVSFPIRIQKDLNSDTMQPSTLRNYKGRAKETLSGRQVGVRSSMQPASRRPVKLPAL
jgi:hypothetical protein